MVPVPPVVDGSSNAVIQNVVQVDHQWSTWNF